MTSARLWYASCVHSRYSTPDQSRGLTKYKTRLIQSTEIAQPRLGLCTPNLVNQPRGQPIGHFTALRVRGKKQGDGVYVYEVTKDFVGVAAESNSNGSLGLLTR
jgi:hypothetical protein